MRLALFTILSMAAVMSAQPPPRATGIPEFGAIGTGQDTVLILPCMSCRWTAWESFMRAHGDRFTFVAVTPPGFGGTPSPAPGPAGATDTPWRRNLLNELSAFLDQHRIRRAVILGHSWGSMVAVQLAAIRPDIARGVVAVDGALESTTWLPSDSSARVSSAASLRQGNLPLEASAEAWSQFNRFQLPPDSLLPRRTVRDLMLLHGAFTATSRDVLFGYWRENFLIDITSLTRAIAVPVLDVKCLWPGLDADSVRAAHRAALEQAGIAKAVTTLFMPNTVHHVMLHRPAELAAILADFTSTLGR